MSVVGQEQTVGGKAGTAAVNLKATFAPPGNYTRILVRSRLSVRSEDSKLNVSRTPNSSHSQRLFVGLHFSGYGCLDVPPFSLNFQLPVPKKSRQPIHSFA